MEKTRLWASVTVLCALPIAAAAQRPEQKVERAAQTVQQRCDKEIKAHCKDVMKGQGRIAACLYAHEDKLSATCEYALYDAADELQQAANELSQVATTCQSDLQRLCTNVQPGAGRLRTCIDQHRRELTPRCEQALRDSGY
jgi:hypothetical protein